jgi:hypothetical protein
VRPPLLRIEGEENPGTTEPVALHPTLSLAPRERKFNSHFGRCWRGGSVSDGGQGVPKFNKTHTKFNGFNKALAEKVLKNGGISRNPGILPDMQEMRTDRTAMDCKASSCICPRV